MQQRELCLESMSEITQCIARALPTLTQDHEQTVELLHEWCDFCWHARINAVDLATLKLRHLAARALQRAHTAAQDPALREDQDCECDDADRRISRLKAV